MTREQIAAQPIKNKAQEHWVPPRFYNDLDSTLSEAWCLLRRGVSDHGSSFHTPTIATVRQDGAPAVRTVVLRAVDPAQRTLRFHTDIRSAKLQEISMDPRVALHFYDAAKKVQLRIDGLATMHADDDAAAEAWRATRAFSRLCYRIQPSPGSEIDDPSLLQGPVKATSDDAGRENFAAVSVSIHNIEWLYLAARGHRRARFVWNSDTLSAHWLVP